MPSEKIYSGLGWLIWRVMLLAVVVLAVYVSGTRALLRTLPLYEEQILDWLSTQANVRFEAGHLSGNIASFMPVIVINDLQLVLPDDTPVAFTAATISIDPWATLLDRQVRLDALQLQGFTLALPVDALQQRRTDSGQGLEQGLDLLAAFRTVSVVDAKLALHTAVEQKQLMLSMELRRAGSERQLSVALSGPGGAEFALSGTGVGNLAQWQSLTGNFHGHLVWQDLSWLSDLLGDDFDGQGSLDVWYDSDGRRPRFTVDAALTNLRFRFGDAEPVQLDRASLAAQLLPKRNGWLSQIENLDIATGDARFELARLDVVARDRRLDIATANLDLSELAGLLIEGEMLSGKPAKTVERMAPSGMLLGLTAQIGDLTAPSQRWSMVGQIQNFSMQPGDKIPGLDGIDATIEATEEGATAWIDTEDFSLTLPKVYTAPLEFPAVLGRLSASWTPAMLYLHDGVLRAVHSEHTAQILFGMNIPIDRNSPHVKPLSMHLDVGVPEADASLREVYVPYRIPKTLVTWLEESRLQGDLSALQFLWRGGFKNFGSGQQSMQLGAILGNAGLRFQSDWPLVDSIGGTLLIDTQTVSVWAEQGSMAGVTVRDASVEIGTSAAQDSIAVNGAFAGAAADAISLLRNSPVYDAAGAVLDDFTMGGAVQGHLDLSLALRAPQVDPDVGVDFTLEGARLASKALDLQLENLAGNVSFDLQRGFQGNALEATLFSKPVAISLEPGSSGLDDARLLDGRFEFDVPGDELWQWGLTAFNVSALNKNKASPFDGSAEVEVAVAVGSSARAVVRTDLGGMAVVLPEPLGKSAGQSTAFDVTIDTKPGVPWEIFWAGRGQALLERRATTVTGVMLDVTPREQAVDLPSPPANGAFNVVGRLDRIPVDPWLATLGSLSVADSNSQAGLRADITELTIDELVVGTIALEDVAVDLTPYSDWDLLGINTAWLDAELTLPRDDREIVLIINQLDYDAIADLKTVETDLHPVAEAEVERRPPSLPVPVDIAVANLSYRGKSQGAARFTLNSAPDALVISDVQGQLAGLKLGSDSSLTWREDSEGQWQTQMSLDAQVDDVAKSFESLSAEPLVTTEAGQLTANLSWPGGPTDIDLQRLTGTADIDLRNGSFLPVPSGATGAVRLLGLLNLAGLFGRADVTRIFDPGVAFRSAAGELQFNPGTVAIPGFEITGPGGGFSFYSDIDLSTEMMEGELVVTLPLVENIPWMAALVGGLPVAAGAYLLSKVFESQVRQLSSGVYSVSGNISSPQVTFERIFDANTTVAADAAVPAIAGETQSDPSAPNSSQDAPSEGDTHDTSDSTASSSSRR